MQLGSIVIVMIDCLITLYAYDLDVDMYIKLKKNSNVLFFLTYTKIYTCKSYLSYNFRYQALTFDTYLVNFLIVQPISLFLIF